jgi:ATP-dependent Clp protease ATP-binding subunit ClpC
MFERYTDKARRVVFFARYEASQFGSPCIEAEHLLLGILREYKEFSNRFLGGHASVESIRKTIEANTPVREKTSTSVDLPLSNECKRILAYAAEEAERLSHRHVGSEHLLLGLLREEGCFAASLLKERGVQLETLREELKNTPPEPPLRPTPRTVEGSGPSASPASLDDFARDLTQAAMEGQLDPLLGREPELKVVIEILCRRFRRSVLLIGERGAGKSALVEGLAQQITEGQVPAALADKRLMVLEAEIVSAWAGHGRNAEQRLNQVIQILTGPGEVILFIDDLERFIGAAMASGAAVASGVLKYWLLRGKLICLAACTPAEYAQLSQAVPWIRECFSEVHVRPLDEAMTLRVLESRKHHFESFHEVTYADEALQLVAAASDRYLPHKPAPGKALELLDAAGAHVKLRQAAMPEEIRDTMRKIKLIASRTESALHNHEFEKARFYSDEETKERASLEALRSKYGADVPSRIVTPQDVEGIIAQWSTYPFRP